MLRPSTAILGLETGDGKATAWLCWGAARVRQGAAKKRKDLQFEHQGFPYAREISRAGLVPRDLLAYPI
jgi:hypothetical protein